MSTPLPASPLVSAGWLAAHLGDPELRLVDVRWYLDGRSGPAAHEAGHIPGAVHLDVDRDLASPRGPGRPGRHPLPDAAHFAGSLAKAGIGAGSHVVAYDDEGGAIAARLWWLLGYFSHPARASVLDGGLQAWQAAGQPLEVGQPAPRAPAAPAALKPRPGWVASRDQVRAISEGAPGVLIDARAAPRYEGTVEPVDPRAGHIPGAISAPYAGNLREPRGEFLTAEQLRFRYASLLTGNTSSGQPGEPGSAARNPSSEFVVYCGSGVTACHDVLALAVAGRGAKLYEGSWSDWSSEPSLPIKTGNEP
jgi:thiosulfate/3-mercaptopyruvate sulfurtransferase